MSVKVDIHGDFDKLNPIIAIGKAFKDLKQHIPSDQYNKCMWSIFMLEYPFKNLNPKADIPYEQRLSDIKKSYYNDFDIADPYVKSAIDEFAPYCLTFEQQMFKIQKDKLDEFTMYFRNLDMTTKLDDYLKISKTLKPIWDNFDKARKEMLKADTDKENALGDIKLSNSELRRMEELK